MKNLKWMTANCSQEYSFVCEKEAQCEYTENVNITLEDVGITELTHTVQTSLFPCRELCYGLAVGDEQGCSVYQDNDTCFFLFVDSGTDEYLVEDSFNGTSYHIKNCSKALISVMLQESSNQDDFPNTECAVALGDDYFEYLDDYRVAIIPSLYKTIDILGDVEKCKSVCLQTEVNRRKCWAVNMFSVLSNFCRLYYLYGEPPYLFYQRYVSNTPGPLLLRRRLSRHQILDDNIVDNIAELIVDPKNTTLYNLKFISVYENKPAKITLGVIGAVFIGTAVIGVILVDCPLICKHVRVIAARNIRKRTICKNKKPMKITNIMSSNKIGQSTSTETKESMEENKRISITPSKNATSNKDKAHTQAGAHCSKQKEEGHDKVFIYDIT